MYKKDFPIFTSHSDTIYLDSASTAQKPQKVIDAIADFYHHDYANIHRGAYDLSERSELLYEASKEKYRQAIHAESRYEIVYTYSATYATNYLARSLADSGMISRGDTIVLSLLDHHANIVPWQLIARSLDLQVRYIGVTPDGRLDLSDIEEKCQCARLISVTAASNVTGAITDIAKIRDSARKAWWDDIFLIIDGSQALPHFSVDVVDLDIDFLISTGHKMMSDTGLGILYGKKSYLQQMEPAFCGGGAINSVTTLGYEAAGLPYRHEPGTPHIAWAVSLLAALEYIESIGWYPAIESYEHDLIEYTLSRVPELPSHIRLIWPMESVDRLGVFSFDIVWHHPADVADRLAAEGVCIRVWHHCTEPLHDALGLSATLRMSLYIYTTRADIDRFFDTIIRVCR